MADQPFDQPPRADQPFTIASHDTHVRSAPEPLAAAFARTPMLVCRDVIDPPLLDRLRCRGAAARYVSSTCSVGSRALEQPSVIGATLCVLLQRPALLQWVSAVTSSGPLGWVTGVVAQTGPEPGAELLWHDDLGDPDSDRRVAITIDLSTAPYAGGAFELRGAGASEVTRFHHDRPGSALLFAIRPSLEHRLLPVIDGGPRRVFAGWFHAARADA